MIACPSDEDLAGHLAGALDATRAGQVGDHLDGCPGCRAIVVGAVRGGVISLAEISDATIAVRESARARRRETLTPGTAVGRYRIVDLLGAGGMGVVYVAHDDALDRQVALKVLRPDLAGDPATLAERLVRESRLMAKASHPGVITVHDVGRDGDQVYVAMELIRGETLGRWLRRSPRRVDDVIELFRRAGAGLGAAHRAGMVHRDFKPDNVLVELDGDAVRRVLVTDFGVARAIAAADDGSNRPPSGEVDLTATGVAVGTPAYMAPEQLSGGDVDERADVFGFAVALWEALYGARPFTGATPALIRAAMNRIPAPPAERPLQAARGRVPGWVTRALLAALVADPRHRTPTISALLAALDPAPRRRRGRRLAALIATLVVSAGVVTTILAWPAPAAAPDPCDPGRAALAGGWSPQRAAEARTALAAHAAPAELVTTAIGKLDTATLAWRDLHASTCAHPRPEVAACLDARLLELGAVGDELVGATAAAIEFPDQLAKLVGDPAACATGAPGLHEASVPVDPALQRAVADLRRRVFEVEATRIDGDYPAALAAIPALEEAARTVGFDRVLAEVLYLRGSTETVGSDTVRGVETLRLAAVTAQRAHYDSIAASVWIVLAHTTALDLHDTDRALEYLDYAQPAIDRLGSPPALAAQLLYTRGVVELDALRDDDAEAHMRQAQALADPGAPELVPLIVQGLAFVLENRGRYADAAAQYARAIDFHVAQHGPGKPEEAIYRCRYASNLAHSGQVDAAIEQARQALAIAEATLDEKQIDRMHAHVTLAEVLRVAGHRPEALAEIDVALAMTAAIVGARDKVYGETLQTRGERLQLGRYREALAAYTRACEILEFTTRDESVGDVLCRVDMAQTVLALGRTRAALAMIDDAAEMLATLSDDPGQLANAQLVRGDILVALHRDAEAAVVYEQARTGFGSELVDDGLEAAAEWGLAQALVKTDRARALTWARSAIEKWKHGPPSWAEDLKLAEAWLRARAVAALPSAR